MAKWIICCGMVRSASTLQYQIIKSLIEKLELGKGIGYFEGNDLIENLLKRKNEKITYVVKVHNFLPITNIFNNQDFHFIYSYRDVRDIVVSLMKKENSSFEELYNKHRFNNYLINHYKWTSIPNTYISSYENLVYNLKNEIINIAKYLDIIIDDNFADELSQSYNLSNQLNYIKRSEMSTIKNYDNHYNPETLLHPNHIHSGKSEQWKIELSNYQIAIIQNQWNKWLLEQNYRLHFSIFQLSPIFRVYNMIIGIQKFGILKFISLQINKINNRNPRKLELRWNKFQLSDQESYIKKLSNRSRLKLYKDSKLSEYIFKEKFEKKEIAFLNKYLNKGDVFFDVGANIGLYSVIAAKRIGKSGKVIAFEPVNKTYSRLLENMQLNNFQNYECLNSALSNKTEKAHISVSLEGYDAWNSLGKPSSGNIFKEEIIDTITMDQYITDNSIKNIDFIKIDVEGWELNVLKGCEHVLKTMNPALMIEFTEMNQKNAGLSGSEIKEYLFQLGYSLYKISDNLELILETSDQPYLYENLIGLKN